MDDDPRAGMRRLVTFLCVVALVATPWVALSEADWFDCFIYCGAEGIPLDEINRVTPPEEANGVSVAFILGTVLPVLGIGLSTYTGQRTARLLFGLVLTLTLFIGLAASADDRPIRLPPEPPRGCQEHSGGLATCPGG